MPPNLAIFGYIDLKERRLEYGGSHVKPTYQRQVMQTANRMTIHSAIWSLHPWNDQSRCLPLLVVIQITIYTHEERCRNKERCMKKYAKIREQEVWQQFYYLCAQNSKLAKKGKKLHFEVHVSMDNRIWRRFFILFVNMWAWIEWVKNWKCINCNEEILRMFALKIWELSNLESNA